MAHPLSVLLLTPHTQLQECPPERQCHQHLLLLLLLSGLQLARQMVVLTGHQLPDRPPAHKRHQCLLLLLLSGLQLALQLLVLLLNYHTQLLMLMHS
jgi:hypothetical protein